MARPRGPRLNQFEEAGRRPGTGRARAPRPSKRLPRQRRRRQPGGTQRARASLRHFRQATILAVAITSLLFLVFGLDEEGGAQEPPAAGAAQVTAQELPDTVAVIEEFPLEELQAGVQEEEVADEDVRPDALVARAMDEARATLRGLWYGFLVSIPQFAVALLALLVAWAAVRLLRPILRRVLVNWERSTAATALFGIVIWLFAIGVAVSVIAGDIRALVGSLGLVGLALSWALQTPIESFTGWLFNSFQGYYRVGDRVAVGDVFGDVYRIDFLTTTVWEIGSLDRPGFVQAEQPTGRLITFPNNEVLAGSIVNLTRDFPYVWDELTVPVANKSDLSYGVEVLRRVAVGVLGDQMAEPAVQYGQILSAMRLETEIAQEPQVFVSLDDSWTNLTVRYLVGARERRRWKSLLAKAVMEELNSEEHADRIISVFPRRQIQFIGPDGKATEVPGVDGREEGRGKREE
jgi:small-conductance mechanosensitive channel